MPCHAYVTERRKTGRRGIRNTFPCRSRTACAGCVCACCAAVPLDGLAEDITSDRMSLERMEYERDHDVLTELYNRRAFKRMALALRPEGRRRRAWVRW